MNQQYTDCYQIIHNVDPVLLVFDMHSAAISFPFLWHTLHARPTSLYNTATFQPEHSGGRFLLALRRAFALLPKKSFTSSDL